MTANEAKVYFQRHLMIVAIKISLVSCYKELRVSSEKQVFEYKAGQGFESGGDLYFLIHKLISTPKGVYLPGLKN